MLTGLSDALPIDVDIQGANQLKLVVTPGPDGNFFDHAAWGNVRAQQAGPLEAASPNAPIALAAVAASDEKINLTWRDRSNNETSFRIERSTNGTTFELIAGVQPGQYTYVDAGLDPSSTYTYRVLASNEYGDSAYSAEASATTLPHGAFSSAI